MEKTKKRKCGALALTTALVLAGCLNSRPLYAVGLEGERQPLLTLRGACRR